MSEASNARLRAAEQLQAMLPELSLPIVRLIIDYMSSPPARLVIATRVRAFLRREQDLTIDQLGVLTEDDTTVRILHEDGKTSTFKPDIALWSHSLPAGLTADAVTALGEHCNSKEDWERAYDEAAAKAKAAGGVPRTSLLPRFASQAYAFFALGGADWVTEQLCGGPRASVTVLGMGDAAGTSHTCMGKLGEHGQQGLLCRVAERLLQQCTFARMGAWVAGSKDHRGVTKVQGREPVSVHVSCFECYTEKLTDLLSPRENKALVKYEDLWCKALDAAGHLEEHLKPHFTRFDGLHAYASRPDVGFRLRVTFADKHTADFVLVELAAGLIPRGDAAHRVLSRVTMMHVIQALRTRERWRRDNEFFPRGNAGSASSAAGSAGSAAGSAAGAAAGAAAKAASPAKRTAGAKTSGRGPGSSSAAPKAKAAVAGGRASPKTESKARPKAASAKRTGAAAAAAGAGAGAAAASEAPQQQAEPQPQPPELKIRWRDSVLTRLLQPVLEPPSSLVVVCLSLLPSIAASADNAHQLALLLGPPLEEATKPTSKAAAGESKAKVESKQP